MLKILVVLGTRPEATKLAPVIQVLQQRQSVLPIQTIVCVTGQHRQMVDQLLPLFNIVPDYDLAVMQPNQTPSQVTSAVLTKLEPILQRERPAWVIVQGDTTTVMATTIAAYYARIKVAHVEAGLRTQDKWNPFPEEGHRRIVSAIADYHFAPTAWACQNLLTEGVPANQICVSGNTAIDAVQWMATRPLSPSVKKTLAAAGLNAPNRRLVLVTAHRRENFGRPLRYICQALKAIAAHYGDHLRIVYPVHLNPNIKDVVSTELSGIENIILLPPVDYQLMVALIQRAHFLLTDSGGLQEEAAGLQTPVLVMRDVTERPEGVESGILRLVGTQPASIVAEARRLLDDAAVYQQMAQAPNPYGDGQAAHRIVQILLGETMLPLAMFNQVTGKIGNQREFLYSP